MKSRQRIVDTLPTHDDLLLAGSDEPGEELSAEERVSQWDAEYWQRLDDEVRYFGGPR